MDVLGIGVPFCDLLLGVDEIPPADGMTRLHNYLRQGGGKVATAMVAVARLGKTAAFLGVIGNDTGGEMVKRDFLYNGVNTEQIIVDDCGESAFVVAISEEKHKDRRFLGTVGTVRSLRAEDVDAALVRSVKVLHLEAATEAAVCAAQTAKKSGVCVTFDGDYYSADTDAILPYVDVFIGSEMYYNGAFQTGDYEENCRCMMQRGPQTVIFTLGSKGCVGCDAKTGFFTLPSRKVTVVDTTGAGDVFHGAYIVAMLEGKCPREAALFATAVSAIQCTQIGGRTSIPTKAVAEKFMSTGIIDTQDILERVEHYRRER